MKQRSGSSLLFLLLSISVNASDQQSGGRVTHTAPNGGGSVSMNTNTPGFDTGKADINPNYGHNSPQTGGSSSVGGVVGALYNVGKKLFGPSERELRADRATAQRDAEEREMMSRRGDPRIVAGGGVVHKYEDYSEFERRSAEQAAQAFAQAEEGRAKAAKYAASTPKPTPAAQPKVQTPTPEPTPAPKVTAAASQEPVAGYPSSVGSKRSGVTCLPMVGEESRQDGGLAPKASAPMGEHKAPKMPTILNENPFGNRSDNNDHSNDTRGGGGMGSVGILGTGGLLAVAKIGAAAKVPATIGVAAPLAITVSGAGTAAAGGTAGAAATTTVVAGGGGTVAGTTTIGVVIGAAAPIVGVMALAGAGALGACMLYDGIFNPGIGWWPSNAERDAYHARRAALLSAAKVPHPSNNNPSNGGGNNNQQPGNPKDPKEPKERKFNTVQKTEGLRKLKENYRYDKQSNLYKLKDNGTPIKCTRTGKEVKAVKWDHSHGDVEAINKQGVHMGSLDPVTFEMYKAPVKHRNDPL